MKLLKSFILFFAVAFCMSAAAQNVSINILTQNSGQVFQGGTVFLQIDISNTDGALSVPVYKLRPQISFPNALVTIPATGHSLPTGWTLPFNSGGVIRLSNGTDVIPPGVTRTILIAVQGTNLGGPSTISANLLFSNGNAPGTASGTATPGDGTADNTSTSTVEVLPAPACNLSVSAAAGTIACNGGTTTLTATPSGNTGAVEYSLNGGAFQSSNTFTVNAAGSPYTVTAREATNTSCTASSSAVTVSEPTAVVASGSVTTPIATIGGTGSITVTAAGGTAGTTTYVITSGTTINTTGAATGVFTGLLAGTYTFTATKNGCVSAPSAGVVLNDPAPCIITSVSASAGTIACNGGTTTLTATASPSGPTYQYSLNGGAFQSSNTFTVSGGSYTVVAREAGNTVCTATSSAVVVANPSVVTATGAVSTAIAVPGGTGAITVTSAGGSGTGYSYVIVSGTTINTTGATTGIFTGLLAGSYTFTATDGNGCVSAVSAAVTLANPGIATADPAVGQMYFTTTGGGVQNANTLLLSPSTAVYDINIPFYNLNQANVVPNGTINFRINLGSKLIVNPGFSLATAPLSTYFSWAQSTVGGNVILTGTQIATIPADFSGIAKFRVKGDSACSSNVVSNIVITNVLQTLADDDVNNNQATLQYTLPVTLTNTQVNVTCNGAGNGIINVTVSSGTVVTISGPNGYSNTQNIASGVNNFTLSSLAPGTYTITASAVSDGALAACSAVNTVIISQPTVLSIPSGSISSTNNSCYNGAEGTITVAAVGGTAPYTYTIAGPTVNTTGALNGVFTGLTAGSYTVTVTDNNGCTATTAAVVITQPAAGTPDITLGSDISGSLFATNGTSQTIVYNIAEIAGNSAVGDTLRITKVAGYTINFNPTLFSTNATGTLYALDNTRWKIDNSDPAFVSIILTDPLNASNPGTLLCNQLVRVAVTITRNTSDVSTFPLSARLRRANGEVNLSNNLNSIVFTAD